MHDPNKQPTPAKHTEPHAKPLPSQPGKPSTTIPSDDAIGSHPGSGNQSAKPSDKR